MTGVRLEIAITLNGRAETIEAPANEMLIDTLRDRFGLTGTKLSCDQATCGACTVLVDGESVRSCLLLAVQVDGCEIRSVESLGTIDRLSPLQEAFREHHGLQCGFCTPGMLMTATDLLERSPLATDEEIREGMSGNLCRCTGYQGIVNAVRAAARARVEKGPP